MNFKTLPIGDIDALLDARELELQASTFASSETTVHLYCKEGLAAQGSGATLAEALENAFRALP